METYSLHAYFCLDVFMEDELSVDYLFSKFQEERKTGELLPLAKDFYKKSEEYIKKEMITEPNETKTRQIENFKRLLTEIQERRIQKILIYIAYNKKLPTLVPEEEENLYSEIKAQISNAYVIQGAKVPKVRMIADIPEVVIQTGKKIGPFSKNQIIEVSDEAELEFLLNNKLCEII